MHDLWADLKAAPARFWASLGAAIVVTVMVVALILIVWIGGWPPSIAHLQLDYLGIALLIALAGLITIVLRIFDTKLRLGFRGVNLETGGDQDVRITTVAPKPPVGS